MSVRDKAPMNENEKYTAPGIVGFVFRILSLLCLISLLTFATIFADNSRAAPTAPFFWLKPVDPVAYTGEYTDVTFRLDDISNVYGAEFTVDYDSSILSVVDATGTPSGAIIPGSCPAPDLIITNSATAGTIHYKVTQLLTVSPAPCNGGDMAKVYFRCADSITTETVSWISITSSFISDPDGSLISHETQNAIFTCKPKIFTYLPAIFK
jgi:hypothetical protein